MFTLFNNAETLDRSRGSSLVSRLVSRYSVGLTVGLPAFVWSRGWSPGTRLVSWLVSRHWYGLTAGLRKRYNRDIKCLCMEAY